MTQEEFDANLAELEAAAARGEISPEEAEQLATQAFETYRGSFLGVGELASKAGKAGMAGLDVSRGAAAMGLLAGGEAFGKAAPGTTQKAWEQVKETWRAPENVEVLKSLNLPVPESSLGQFAVNAIDPAMLASFGGAAAAKAGFGKAAGLLTKAGRAADPVLTGLGKAMPIAGRQLNRWGFRHADTAAQAAGKAPFAVSDVAAKYGIKGGAEDVAKQSLERIALLEDEIQGLLGKVPGKIDVDRAFGPAKKNLMEIIDNPGVYTSGQVRAAKAQLKEIERLTALNRYTPEQVIPGQVIPEVKIDPLAGQQTSLLAPSEALPVFQKRQQAFVEMDQPIAATPLAPMEGGQMNLFPVNMRQQRGLLSDPYAVKTKVSPEQMVKAEDIITSMPAGQQTTFLTGAEAMSRRPEIIPEQIIPEQVIPATKGMTAKEAKELNKNIYASMKKSAWTDMMSPDVKTAFNKALTAGNKEEYMRIAREFDPALAAELESKLADQAALLTARKAMGKEATKEATRKGFTEIDAMSAYVDPLLYGAKQAGKHAFGSGALTRGGQFLMKEDNPLIRALIRGTNAGFYPLLNPRQEQEQ